MVGARERVFWAESSWEAAQTHPSQLGPSSSAGRGAVGLRGAAGWCNFIRQKAFRYFTGVDWMD